MSLLETIGSLADRVIVAVYGGEDNVAYSAAGDDPISLSGVVSYRSVLLGDAGDTSIATTRPALFIINADLVAAGIAPAEGDTLTCDSKSYRVTQVDPPDDGGGRVLWLHRTSA